MEGIKILRVDRSPIKRNVQYPEDPPVPISGYEFGGSGPEEWLLVVRQPYNGEVDSNYYSLVEIQDAPEDRIEHPEYPGIGQWVIKQVLVPLTVAERLQKLENAENLANEIIFPAVKQLKYLSIALVALAKKVLNNSNLDLIDQKAVEHVRDAVLSIKQNFQTRVDYKSQIEADGEPDLDNGWINTEQPEPDFSDL